MGRAAGVDLFAFEDQVDRIGPPPGVVSPGGEVLTGTPYGSGPAWDNGTSTYDKAFDGDVSTYVDLAAANGGYAGLDLGRPATVSEIRFVPRSASMGHTLRMVGGVFQGCTTGPASGCHDLATVRWRPTYDWMTLPVADQHAYRWLRYVSPDGGFTNVAEIQFHGGPPSPAHLSAPATLPVLGDDVVRATLTNTSDLPLVGLHASLYVRSTDDLTPLATRPVDMPGAVPPHSTATLTWRADVPLDAPAATYRLDASLSWRAGATHVAALTTVPVPVHAGVDPASVAVAPGGTANATLHVTSAAGAPLTVDWSAPGLTPSSGTVRVAPGGTADATLTATGGSTPGVTGIPITLTARGNGQSVSLDPLTLRVSVPFPSLARAFDNIGITDDADPSPSNIDGGVDGDGSTYSTQALAAAGATPGGTITHGGVTFSWPDVPADTADNVLANGQVIDLPGSGSTLGLLTVGTYGPISGTGTVTYTDGSTQPFTITDPDWQAAPPPGSDIALTTTYHHFAGSKIVRNAYVYFHGVPLDASKAVASVTLPAVSDHATGGTAALHVFAVAIGP